MAHSNLIGITAPSEARHPLQGVTVWRAATFGIWTYNVHVDTHTDRQYRLTGPPLVERVVVGPGPNPNPNPSPSPRPNP